MTRKMTRERVAEIVSAAREKVDRPNLRYEHLDGLDLSGLNLSNADMTGAHMKETNFAGATLYRVDMTGAYTFRSDFSRADFRLANLTDAYMGRANLTDASFAGALLSRTDFHRANMYSANLIGAYLAGADFEGANFAGASLTGLAIEGLPSGPLLFIPTLQGWSLKIGCWHGTLAELREMISKDTGWPEARGKAVEVRRPMLEAAADLCEVYATEHPDALKTVKFPVDRWKGEWERKENLTTT